MKHKVLVTRRWLAAVGAALSEEFDVTLNKGDAALSEDELRRALADYDEVLPTVTDKLGPSVFELASPRTRILANYGVGFSHIDTASAERYGIMVTNTPDALSDCTADIAMTLLLIAARASVSCAPSHGPARARPI